MSLLSRTDRVVCSSLELVQTQPSKAMPSYKIALALSNHGMSEMKNGSLSRQDLFKRPPWSMLSPQQPCCYPWSVLWPQAVLKPEVHSEVWADTGGHIKAQSSCYHRRPGRLPSSVLPQKAMLVSVCGLGLPTKAMLMCVVACTAI